MCLDKLATEVVIAEFKSTVSVNCSLCFSKGAALHLLGLVDAFVRVVVLVVALVSLLLSLWIRSIVESPELADPVEHTAVVAVYGVPSVEHHLRGGTCKNKS